MKKQLPDGIIVPLPTPLLGFDKVDYDGLNNLVEYLIKDGVAGISILGNTGEERCLDYVARKSLISETCRIVNGRMPVFVSISDTSFNESYVLAGFASECGATGMVFSPPYYMTAGQAELIEYYDELLKVICLPIVLNNYDSTASIKLEPATILKLINNNKIVGLKDNSSDIIYMKHVVDVVKSEKPDFKLYFGKEDVMFETVMIGGNGGFVVGANIFPKLYIKLYEAIKVGDFDTYKALQPILLDINKTIFGIGHYHSSYLKGIKCALNIMGLIKDDYMVPPFHKFNAPERERIANGLLVIRHKLQEYGFE